MKRLSHTVVLSAAVALVVACAPEPEPEPDTGETETANDTAAQPTRLQQPDTTIMISLVDGRIVVNPDSVGVRRGNVVRWAAADPEAVWVVVFAGGTPMQAGRRVLNGGGPGNGDRAPVSLEAATGQAYKYWVFHPDGEGGYLQLDPKLVIIEDPGTNTTGTQ